RLFKPTLKAARLSETSPTISMQPHQVLRLVTLGLLASVCLLPAPADAVKCYDCADCSSVSSSTQTVSGSYCVKVKAAGVIGRTAAPACVATSKSWCCDTDLCNSSPRQFGPSGLLLTAALALLAAVCKQ
ncbi:hypothetical protein BOX15_Mlig002865g1, partial [Macrostomum lignano]